MAFITETKNPDKIVKFLTRLVPVFKFQIHIFDYALDILTQIFHSHLKLNMCRTELLIPLYSIPNGLHLSIWQHHQLLLTSSTYKLSLNILFVTLHIFQCVSFACKEHLEFVHSCISPSATVPNQTTIITQMNQNT